MEKTSDNTSFTMRGFWRDMSQGTAVIIISNLEGATFGSMIEVLQDLLSSKE